VEYAFGRTELGQKTLSRERSDARNQRKQQLLAEFVVL